MANKCFSVFLIIFIFQFCASRAHHIQSNKVTALNTSLLNRESSLTNFNADGLAIKTNEYGKLVLNTILEFAGKLNSNVDQSWRNIFSKSILEGIKSRKVRETVSSPKIGERILTAMDQLNWGSLLLKLIKTVVEFMIDVLAGVMLGKSALSPPLKSF
uniref:Uncharacterized protein n=1 Tax=Tetranychus urticae TaxID=32264 RepID=T1KW54_TETUR